MAEIPEETLQMIRELADENMPRAHIAAMLRISEGVVDRELAKVEKERETN